MRPELERMQLLEDYLHHRLPAAETIDLELRLLLDDSLRDELEAQRQTYHALRMAGRQQLRGELEAIHQRLYCYTWLHRLGYALAFAAGTWAWWQWVSGQV